MKKICIRLSLLKFISFFFLVVGIVMLWNGTIKLRNLSDIRKLQNIQLKVGSYVDVDNVTFLTKIDKLSKQKLYSSQTSISLLGTENEYYTIEMKKGYYITLLVKDSQQDKILSGKAFQGKVVKLSTQLNYPWYRTILNVDTNERVDKAISPKYAIEIVDFLAEKSMFNKGMLIFFIGIVLFIISPKMIDVSKQQ